MLTIANGWSFQVHGGGGHEGGIVEVINDLLVFISSLTGHSGGEIFHLLMPGIAGMLNFHPLAVHFPIALLTMFFLVELISVCFRKHDWRVLANGLLYSGTAFAALTVYLGYKAAETVPHDDVAHAIMERHESLGVSILLLAGFLSFWRLLSNQNLSIQLKSLFLVFAGILNIMIILAADLGGLMVYGHGVGVKAVIAGPETAGAADAVHHHEHGGGDHDHDRDHHD